MLGMPISTEMTCFIGSFPEGMSVVVNGRKYFLRYTDFPWFEYCSVAELRDVTSDRWGVYWNSLDIDLSTESLENPERFPEKISIDAWLRARQRNGADAWGDSFGQEGSGQPQERKQRRTSEKKQHPGGSLISADREKPPGRLERRRPAG